MPIVPAGNRTKLIATGTPYSPAVSFNPDKKAFFDTHPGNLGVLVQALITTDGVNVTIPTGFSFIQNGIIVTLTAPFVIVIPGIAFPKYVVASVADENPASAVTIEILAAAPPPLVILATLTPNNSTLVFPKSISIRRLSERIADLEDNMYAATLRVNPVAGVGDYTTLQAALNGLPARGGRIFMSADSFLTAVEISVPNDVKEVEIVGCGSGFDDGLGTVIDIAGNGIAAIRLLGKKHVKISNIRFKSTGAAGSIFLKADNPDDSNFMDLVGVVAQGFEKMVKVTAGGLLLRGVHTYFDTAVAGSKGWEGLGQFEGENCQINADSVSGPVSFIGNNFNLVLEGAVNQIQAFLLSNSFLCGEFRINVGGQLMLASCNFLIFSITPNRYLDIVAPLPSAVIGCNFNAPATVEEIRNAWQYVAICCPVGTNRPRVTETGAADLNYYDWIDMVNSTIIGPSSVVSGVLKHNISNVTTNAFVPFVTLANPNGLPAGVGAIKNTDGANTLSVKETVTDLWGVTTSLTQDVAPSAVVPLNLSVNINTGMPPYKAYEVAVIDKVGGSHATFELRFSSMGAK